MTLGTPSSTSCQCGICQQLMNPMPGGIHRPLKHPPPSAVSTELPHKPSLAQSQTQRAQLSSSLAEHSKGSR